MFMKDPLSCTEKLMVNFVLNAKFRWKAQTTSRWLTPPGVAQPCLEIQKKL